MLLLIRFKSTCCASDGETCTGGNFFKQFAKNLRNSSLWGALLVAAAASRPTLDRAAFADHLVELGVPPEEIIAADLALAFQAAHGDAVAQAELRALVERAQDEPRQG